MAKAALFAEDKTGKLYVQVAAVMTPMVALIDGLPVTFFGKRKTGYLDIDTAIEWCRKEMAYHDTERYQKMIDVMEREKAKPSLAARETVSE